MVLGLSAAELAEEMGVELPERPMMHRFRKMGGKHFHRNFGGCGCGCGGNEFGFGGSFSNIQGGAVAIGNGGLFGFGIDG